MTALALEISTALGNERGEFRDGDPDMERNENEHPEQAYRRGYQQGAHAVVDALRQADLLDELTWQKLWFVYRRIAHWRFVSRRRLKRHMLYDMAPTIQLANIVGKMKAPRTGFEDQRARLGVLAE